MNATATVTEGGGQTMSNAPRETTTGATSRTTWALRDRGTIRTARSRGALSGGLLVLLGVWGGLVPFIGPYLGYGFEPGQPWMFTWGRFWLEILPAAATILGGLGLLTSANRITGVAAGWLATAAGAWFVVGPQLSVLVAGGGGILGPPLGGTTTGVLATIGMFLGLGAVIMILASTATGRFSVRGVRDVNVAERAGGRTATG